TVLSVALLEDRLKALWRSVAFLGDISYSSYLLHFPLQLAVMGVVLAFGIPQAVFRSPAVLISFMGVLILLSLGSHRFLELPAQRFLRRKGIMQTGRRDLPSTHPGEKALS